MFKNKRIIGIIPARGGSKGLRRKNIINCAGKSLIQWTIEAAANSIYIDRTIISTDSEEIATVAKKCNGDVPFLRPNEFATDKAPMYSVINHAIQWLKQHNAEVYDYFVLLQPTSPLRTSRHIDEAIQHYFSKETGKSETLVSVYKTDVKYGLLMKPNKKGYIKFCFDINTKNSQRQDLPEYFLPNGAIYFSKCDTFKGTFYHEEALYYCMTVKESIDIDTLKDLELAERLLK